jgi:hypothetical protein
MGRIKNLDEIKAELRAMTGKSKIFRRAKIADVESVISHLTSKDPELWAAQWSRVAERYEDTGARHEQDGRFEEARAAYLQAYTYYATGRYPVPHTPGKMQCFRKSLELYERAGRYFEPPLERIEIPYGDNTIPAYVRFRCDGAKHPVVINFGGIDGFKAEAFEYEEAMHRAGLTTCAIDMPGVGESPVKASTTADSLFSAVIDYLEKRSSGLRDRDGRSFMAIAEYFVSELQQRLGRQYFFQENWLRESTNAESYPMDHDIARSMVFGVRNIDELAKVFPSMSLKTQGWLEKPSCPMLIVNGKADLQTPIEDLYILLEYGTPKSARVFPGGHMGQTPETLPTIIRWLKRE